MAPALLSLYMYGTCTALTVWLCSLLTVVCALLSLCGVCPLPTITGMRHDDHMVPSGNATSYTAFTGTHSALAAIPLHLRAADGLSTTGAGQHAESGGARGTAPRNLPGTRLRLVPDSAEP